MTTPKIDPSKLLRIEEAEVSRAEVRQIMTGEGVNACLVVTVKPSPKIGLLKGRMHVIFRGRVMYIEGMHVFDDPRGEYAELALLDDGPVR